jgi:hypothetical protein
MRMPAKCLGTAAYGVQEEAQAKLFADARARSFPLGSADLSQYGSLPASVPFAAPIAAASGARVPPVAPQAAMQQPPPVAEAPAALAQVMVPAVTQSAAPSGAPQAEDVHQSAPGKAAPVDATR